MQSLYTCAVPSAALRQPPLALQGARPLLAHHFQQLGHLVHLAALPHGEEQVALVYFRLLQGFVERVCLFVGDFEGLGDL